MAKVNSLNKTVRELLIGFPKSGKTGSLVSLAEAGYTLRVHSLDGNVEPLMTYASAKAQDRIDVLSRREKRRLNNAPARGRALITDGTPKVFEQVLHDLDDWVTEDDKGKPKSVGSIYDWGPDTVYVLDNGTKLSDAAFARTLDVAGRVNTRPTYGEWMRVAEEMQAFLDMVTVGPPTINCHVIVIFHIKLLGPKDLDDLQIQDKDDEEVVKAKMAKIEQVQRQSSLIPYRWYPTAHGQQLPKQVGGNFGATVLAEAKMMAGRVKRVLTTQPREDVDLAVPASLEDKELPIETGQATIFEAITGKKGPSNGKR